MDCTISFVAPELLYECAICGLSVQRLAFCYNCWDGASDLLYCDTSHGSKNCFGCVCLRKREFCILNKRYSQSDYFPLLTRILGHMKDTGEWGEFFPMNLSPWPYNLSYAARYYPLSRESVSREGLHWLEREDVHDPEAAIGDVPDKLPNTDAPLTVRSASSGKLFRITAEEIKRLRVFRAPLPRLAYDERMNERAKRCGGLKLQERICERSGKRIATVYSASEAPNVWDKEIFDKEFA